MAKLPEEKRAVFTDAYRFYEEHWDKPDSVEEWEARAKELAELCNKHDCSPLAKNLILGAFGAMEDEARIVREAIRNAGTEEQDGVFLENAGA